MGRGNEAGDVKEWMWMKGVGRDMGDVGVYEMARTGP